MFYSLDSLALLLAGKVRDLYDMGDRMLMVATDRVSTYDVVHPTPIPDKGIVLSGMSHYWFQATAKIVGNHWLSSESEVPHEVLGRAMIVQKLRMLPVECIARGY